MRLNRFFIYAAKSQVSSYLRKKGPMVDRDDAGSLQDTSPQGKRRASGTRLG